MNVDWDRLRAEFATGEVRQQAARALEARRFEFADGTIWFPDGAHELTPSSLGLPALFGVMLCAGVGAAVCWADGLVYKWPATGVAVLALVGIALLLRSEARRTRAVESRLERGLFLLADGVLLRSQGVDTRIPKSAISSFVIRHRNRGGERSSPWLHILQGDVDVPTELTAPVLPIFERWLSDAEPDPVDPVEA